MSLSTIELTIAGQVYRLSVAPEDETDLRAAVALVDHQMNRMRMSSSVKGQERIAVMTAIRLASELLERRRGDHGSSDSRILDQEGAIRDRIETMEASLDQALAGYGESEAGHGEMHDDTVV